MKDGVNRVENIYKEIFRRYEIWEGQARASVVMRRENSFRRIDVAYNYIAVFSETAFFHLASGNFCFM